MRDITMTRLTNGGSTDPRRLFLDLRAWAILFARVALGPHLWHGGLLEMFCVHTTVNVRRFFGPR
jgi:hypothetical protein